MRLYKIMFEPPEKRCGVQTQRNPYPLVELPKASYAPCTSSNHRNDKKVYNLHVPLPLAVGTIMTRAECRWYRTLAQMRTDSGLLSDNAVLVYQTGQAQDMYLQLRWCNLQ